MEFKIHNHTHIDRQTDVKVYYYALNINIRY